ncbi:hypothetical protein NX722_09730 [Endozoicomonas gorgoniicola]|uniref:Tubulin/FtsZ 2-layer sandwich domain-containing protein n=1 Tax=Endozoicomonas gorgoniicola TaxID=1234144 RepID=A0ABT3MU79_9GAMM|nr:hypothetical protein [Endozoicomonas gorgoniicola]MCW7552917.1 hypothetical protein [Endozoicomonas gorgoniicola]
MIELVSTNEEISRIVIVSADLKAAKDIDAWQKNVVRDDPENPVLEHYTLQADNIFKVPSVFEQDDCLANTNLLMVVFGDSRADRLPEAFIQLFSAHNLCPLVVLPNELSLTLTDTGLEPSQVVTVTTEQSSKAAVDKILDPFVGSGMINLPVDDLKHIATPGSEGLLISAQASGPDGASEATKKAMALHKASHPAGTESTGILMNISSEMGSLTIGGYVMATDALRESAQDDASVMCSAMVSFSLPEDTFEVSLVIFKS